MVNLVSPLVCDVTGADYFQNIRKNAPLPKVRRFDRS